MVGAHPSIEEIRGWLDAVPDPEIPVLSILDLGIVRGVRYEGDCVVIALTPTYSGCPAIETIVRDVRRHLHALGLREIRVETHLAPAWSTDWITPRGRARLNAYGIAPPAASAPSLAEGPLVSDIVTCPRCRSRATHQVSRFGSTPCKALYRCGDCREPFDYMKPH